jgi:hypothetical protein
MPLPERARDEGQPFPRCLADVVQALGLDVAPEPDAVTGGVATPGEGGAA